MQVVGRNRSSEALQVHKVPSTRGEGFMFKKSSMCTNLLLTHIFSVTSRRGPPMLRRQFYMSRSRRDVDPHVATSIFTLSVTSRRGSTRRDVNFYPLCHVATWIYTSRREFLQASATSRRGFTRRDVGCHPLCDVATSPRTSRCQFL